MRRTARIAIADSVVLGIETSCDETAAAVVERDADGRGRILSNIVRQIAEHAPFGGVVPELAARAHVVISTASSQPALDEAGMGLADIDAIAATAGPGLIGGVLVGLTTAKALSAATGKPLIAVNHLEGHALTARLTDGIDFPYLMLLVSGGHSPVRRWSGASATTPRWGTTIDDALGEAFDKVAKLWASPIPAGRRSSAGRQRAIRSASPSRAAAAAKRLDFSFSGLKTAVRLAAEKIAAAEPGDVADICAGFQAAGDRHRLPTGRASPRPLFAEDAGPPAALVVAGGVAANKAIAQPPDRGGGSARLRLVIRR